MKQNKINTIVIITIVIGLIVLGLVLFNTLSKPKANEEAVKQIETPPQVVKVNDLPLAKRPYVALIPDDVPGQCLGIDLVVENFQNGENKFEYELEYNTKTMIQAAFGKRDLSDISKKHDPLLLGTCSAGRCKCDEGVSGGTIKLNFYGSQEYVLKGDFVLKMAGDNNGMLNSKDLRLRLDVTKSLPKTSQLIISSTIGMPKELESKVLYGPYGIYGLAGTSIKTPIPASFQVKDVSSAKVWFWDGSQWQELKSTVSQDMVSFSLEKLGVIVMTE